MRVRFPQGVLIMKRFALFLFLLPLAATAQVLIPENANRFTYWLFEYGEQTDTTVVIVERYGSTIAVLSPQPEGTPIPGYVRNETYADYDIDSITVTAQYSDSTYYYRSKFSRNDLEWTHANGRWITFINSNKLEFDMDETSSVNATPLPHYGLTQGVMTTYTHNGQLRMKLARAEHVALKNHNTAMVGRRVSPREMDRIKKERLVIATRIFDHTQIHWGAANAHIAGGLESIPYDTVLHYAGGTLVIKRMHLPLLPSHYQHFIEIHQQSNGDAYDRTGSVFCVSPGFFEGINNHPDSLPIFNGRNGERYQGMQAITGYRPLLEWVRFFTPFGVGKFNERMQDLGIDWQQEAYYRQEITDLYTGGDVVVGAWIGNYDGGGHLLTVDIKSYPNEYVTTEPRNIEIVPLFNTCNVLEMAGQNYGKLFGTDSLTVSFRIPIHSQNAQLRYITTGHGGWGEGDEFIPKANTLLIDGQVAFVHTPWRQDCGTWRDLNPVSGNFWNGLSSSDFSRSGWCPGTVAQPIYFDLTPWADGQEHTLTVAIPQGKPVDNMFSYWAVSGVLIIQQ